VPEQRSQKQKRTAKTPLLKENASFVFPPELILQNFTPD
jgi:hypothetical protein